MRISTQSFFQLGSAGISSLQQQLFRTQQKLGAGTKFLTPSDDPVAAARAVGVSETMAENSQYASSRSRAVQTLSMEENALQQGTSCLQDIKTLIVQGGNGNMSDADRAATATALEGDFAQLLRVANSDDGNGQFLFAGFRTGNAPFVQQADGSIAYSGDTGRRLLQVDVARQMAATDDGAAVFQSVQGSAAHVPSAGANNTGTGVMSDISVADGKNYTVTFGAAGAYTVDDGSGNPPVTGVLAAGAAIHAGGLHVTIDGTPAAGDTFTIARNTSGPQADVFQAIRDVINALKAPVTDEVANAKLQNALSTANAKVTNAHDNVLTVRASVGTRLAELDTLDASGQQQSVVAQTYLSQLQDLDYASAITEFSQRQMNLQASEQTFARLQTISLFNYLQS
ncbi:MAG TPA: flagellar hook-associated protein FlgL [Ramlibacter sp.]|nr:flagellar hook-associated protein FlgL [Ramlibacter sp.]